MDIKTNLQFGRPSDSTLLIFIAKLFAICAQKNLTIKKYSLPEGVKRLLHLVSAVPERKGAQSGTIKFPFLKRVVNISIGVWHSFKGTGLIMTFL